MTDAYLQAGLEYILTAQLDRADEHFSPASSASNNTPKILLARNAFGHALVATIRALISFEARDTEEAQKRLSHVQHLTAASFFAMSAQTLSSLDLELIGADTLLFSAGLHFTQESAMGVLKAALALRKANKMYLRAEHEVQKRGPPPPVVPPSSWPTSIELEEFEGDFYFDALPDPGSSSSSPLARPDTSELDRVRGAADLGVGLYSLVLSLIPPRFQTAVAALGFASASTSRTQALAKLRACVDGGTARAPVASLVLLVFHSAMLIFARGVSDAADTREAQHVLDLCLRQYPDSPLFRFFQGRLARGQSRLTHALDIYAFAQTKCGDVHAMRDLCSYERAWVLSALGETANAAGLFARLAKTSRWSPCFYGYLAGAAHFTHALELVVKFGLGAKPEPFREQLESALLPDSPLDAARAAMYAAWQWFKAVPGSVQRHGGRIIPPEAFAEARAQQVMSALARLQIQPDSNWRHQASWKQLIVVCQTLCMPSLEIQYFWNCYFQMTPARREACLRNLEAARLIYKGDTACEPLLCLMRAALLRESGDFAGAEAALGYFQTHQQHQHKESHEASFARFELGMCRFQRGDRTGALQIWGAIGDCGHVFEPRLRFRVRSAMALAQQQQQQQRS